MLSQRPARFFSNCAVAASLRLRTSSNVRLDYGYSLVPPIPDLRIDEHGISATLSFNRIPFATFIPWSAIFLIADFAGRGAVWREDLPPELTADLAASPPGDGSLRGVSAAAETATSSASGAAPLAERGVAPPRRFTVLDGDEAGKSKLGAPDDERPTPDPQRPRPALRLVK